MYNLTKPQKLIYDMEKYAGGTIATISGSIVINGNKTIKELQYAVNEIVRINDALRIRITEKDGIPMQYSTAFEERNYTVLEFESKSELDYYAEKYAKEPIDFYGSLCDINIIVLPDGYGILVKLHHIISDAWTLALIGSHFNSILNGENPECYSYFDYLETEKEYIAGKRYSKDKEHYIEQYKKCDEITYLSDKNATTYITDRKTIEIDTKTTKKITEYAKANNTSIFMLLMTTLGVYFNRVKMNQEKFYLGTAILNRTNAKEKNTMGMYINTSPLLLEIDNDKTFLENVKQISRNGLSLIKHQKFNYGDVLKTLREEFDFNGNLYDVMLSYQNAKVVGMECDFESTWYHCGMQTESLQMHIDDRDSEGILKIHYDYQVEKFTETEIERMHEHIFTLLFDAINEDKKTTELAILSDKEKTTLLYDFNDTKADYPNDKCVHQLFEEQVLKTPEKTAVIACDKTLTYEELNKLSNRIANSLIEKGVKVNDIVAFALPRESSLIAVMFGVLKSGAAYLPIDLDFPQDRVEYMIADSGSKFYITESNLQDFISDNEENPQLNITSDNYCYCIYTSGTTGKPKGTIIRHRNLINFCYNNINNYQSCMINYGTRLISTFKCCFDAFGVDYALFLLNGLSLVLANDYEMTHAEDLAKLIKKHNVDVIHSTPSTIKVFCGNEKYVEAIKKAKVIMVAAENFTPDLYEFLQEHTSAKIFNGYGPSETTIGVSFGEINSTDITIGKPIANIQIYILDKYNNPMSIGQIGELCIAGDGVGAGYLNRPELTAEKFVDNPFGEGKMYKTGDLAYWREDGNIAYVGRNDFQVKIRGLRIELGEIESAIDSVDGVSQAVVVVRKDANGRQLICAFYTEQKSVDVADVKSAISSKLPKYMMPHIFTVLSEMPLTTSGKINRKALPEVDLTNISNDVEYVAPTTEKEIVLTSEIARVLHLKRVGILDNFFDLGGDSLKAIELISKLESKGYKTTVKTVFDCETVKELAEKLEKAETEEMPFEWVGDIPATDAQMRVYTAQSMQENSTLYNVPYCFKTENLDADKLQNAVNKLIERHEMFRTHFENKDGHIIQVINDTASIQVEGLSSDNILDFIRPFALEKAPLIRVGYYKNTVMIDIHHIITDGSSMPIFFNELNELYMGRTLDNTPVQYKEFAVQTPDHADSEKYWLSVFDDEVPVLEINTDFSRGNKQTHNGNALYDTIDIELHNKIKDKCKALNITPYAFYMSGFNILLSKFSGNEDIVVGMPISGRDSKFLNTVGMFVNTIALRNKPVGTKTVSNFLTEVKEISINAIANQDYPFGELTKKLNIETSNRNPLFDVMFAYQSEEMTDVIFGDKKAELLSVPITTSKYDLTLNVMPRENDVVLIAEYCIDLYKESTVKRIINGFKQVLSNMLDVSAELKNISVLSEKEKNTLLYDFNDTKADYPKDKCVHQLFEEQVLRTPDKPAVIACDKILTYDELNRLSNRIANSLIEKGVKANDIVAFALPRESTLIAVMFGVLKSGAAYLPIDLDFPLDRVEYMIADSGSKFYITESNLQDFISDNDETPNVEILSGNYCYCIYTSGTTGKPKGTIIRHRNLVHFCNNSEKNYYQKHIADKTERVISTYKCCFDAFGVDYALFLLNGLCLVLANDYEMTHAEDLAKLIKKHNVDVIHSTPSTIKAFCGNEKYVEAIKKAKVIMVAAENFTPDLYEFLSAHTSAKFFNGYGPSETTIGVSFGEINSIDITIGKPIANTQIYIVDKYNNPMPIGQIGELCIAGDGVGAGYLNRPELTAEKFIDNQFGEGKMYKTGDLAYWREDGNIAYIGRNDFQVKIRGLRIELGEIESAIDSVDGISQAVVVVRKDANSRQLICAFYTEHSKVDVADIKSAISSKLPKYMMPHIFTVLEEMPLTSSGKINRKALPDVDLTNTNSDAEYVKPENKLQQEIASVMEKVLNYSPIGLNDDFFDLGGDSLKAIEFVSKAHSEGIYFNLQAVFDNPTVSKLYDYIENRNRQHASYNQTDFDKYIPLLENNKMECIELPQKSALGNVFITGGTGFLGSHIIDELLSYGAEKVYCLVRNDEQRLYDTLSFYFEDKYKDDARIIPVIGDLEHLAGIKIDDSINFVIHTAASVKNYGSYQYFYDMNVGGTLNAIEFCKNHNAKLIHISTLSVSGDAKFDIKNDLYDSETEMLFDEATLFMGQPLENVYARSKFEAEKVVLDAVLDGLNANIIRVGNLTNRVSDAKFQRNYKSNAFLNRFKAVLELKVFPEYLMHLYTEFSPIDDTAKGIVKIAEHFNNKHTVFNLNSYKLLYCDRLVEILEKLGIEMNIVDGKTFIDKIKLPGSEEMYEALINDMDENGNLVYDSNIRILNDFTREYMKLLGFEWSEIDFEYMKRYVEYFREIGYLEV